MESSQKSIDEMEFSQGTPQEVNADSDEPVPIIPVITPSKESRRSFNFFAEKRASVKRKLDTDPDEKVTDIADLRKGTWREECIKFRVVWTNGGVREADTGTKFFQFMAMDNTGKISCTAFWDLASVIASKIKVGKTYCLKGFIAQDEKEKYRVSGHHLNLSVEDFSSVEEIPDVGINQISYDYKPVAALKELRYGSRADFMGIMVKDWQFDTRNVSGKEKKVREVTLVDENGDSALFVFWEDMGTNFNYVENEAIAIGNLWVTEFRKEKFFNVYNTSTVTNPAICETAQLLKANFAARLEEIEREEL